MAEETLAVPGFPGVWALGDCASVHDRFTGQSYAPTAQNAIRQAARCADNIVASLRGEKMKPFAFKGLGSLASIGGRSAVAQIMGLRIHGFFAWWLWRTIYLMKLPGWERRIRVALDWTLDLMFPRNLVQLNVFRSERVDRAHFEAGETIIRQGEIGDRFYVIARGRVEIPREDGSGQVPVATLGPGEHFGELALLKDVMRTATVRALEPTDLVTMGRGDFAAMAQNLGLLKMRLEETLDRRFERGDGGKGLENLCGQPTRSYLPSAFPEREREAGSARVRSCFGTSSAKTVLPVARRAGEASADPGGHPSARRLRAARDPGRLRTAPCHSPRP